MALDGTAPESTWYLSTVVRRGTSASNSALVLPSFVSNAPNAASVGAKTVSGPGPCSALTKPAACAASNSTVNCPADCAVATMSPVGTAAALAASDMVAVANTPKASVAAAIRRVLLPDLMMCSSWFEHPPTIWRGLPKLSNEGRRTDFPI